MAKQRSFFRSLRSKISIQMLVISLIPILIIGGFASNSLINLEDETRESVDTSYTAMEEDLIQETLSQDAYRLALEMEKNVAVRIDCVKSYASSHLLRDAILSGDPDSIEVQEADNFLTEQYYIVPWFNMMLYTDINGQAIGGAHSGDMYDRVPTPGIYPAYETFLNNDLTGSIWWDQWTNRESDVVVTKMQYSPAWTTPTEVDIFLLDIVAEIQDANGNTIGALDVVTALDPPLLSREYTAKYPDTRVMIFAPPDTLTLLGEHTDHPLDMVKIVADTGEWMLSSEDLNGDGIINDVVPRQTEMVEGIEDPQPVLRWFDFEKHDRLPEADIPYTEAEERVRSIIGDATTQIIKPEAFTTDDGEYVVGYTRAATGLLEETLRTEGYPGTGLTFMTEQPAELAFAALESLDTLESDLESNTQSVITMVLVVLVVAFVVVLIVAFLLSRSITRPIVQLSDAAEKVSMGELDVNVTIKSNDEIGDLADSFSRMVTAVKYLSQDDEK